MKHKTYTQILDLERRLSTLEIYLSKTTKEIFDRLQSLDNQLNETSHMEINPMTKKQLSYNLEQHEIRLTTLEQQFMHTIDKNIPGFKSNLDSIQSKLQSEINSLNIKLKQLQQDSIDNYNTIFLILMKSPFASTFSEDIKAIIDAANTRIQFLNEKPDLT